MTCILYIDSTGFARTGFPPPLLERRGFMSSNPYDRETVGAYSESKFHRTFGIHKAEFRRLLGIVESWMEKKHKEGGRPFRLTAYDRLAITLFYIRQYNTMEIIANYWGIWKGTVCKACNETMACLVTSGVLRLEGMKKLKPGDIVVIDVTESPVDRPGKGQKEFYSGKKKRHTMKTQVVLDKTTWMIVGIQLDKGHVHDFSIYKKSAATRIPEGVVIYADSGYQGIVEYHANSVIPRKKPRGGSLGKSDKETNRKISRERICIEHVNRWLKRFRILKDTYRNKRCNFWKPMYFACVEFNVAGIRV